MGGGMLTAMLCCSSACSEDTQTALPAVQVVWAAVPYSHDLHKLEGGMLHA